MMGKRNLMRIKWTSGRKDMHAYENTATLVSPIMASGSSSSNCDHGPSCCKGCREEINELRLELNLLKAKLKVPADKKKADGFVVPGLDCSDSEYDNIRDCLEVLEINTDGEPTKYKVKEGILEALKLSHSNDRPYVARRITDLLFTKTERTTSNVKGAKGKKQLDQQRMAAVQEGTFQVCEANKNDQPALWRECVKSIDAASRGFGRDRSRKPTKRLREAVSSSPSQPKVVKTTDASNVNVMPVTLTVNTSGQVIDPPPVPVSVHALEPSGQVQFIPAAVGLTHATPMPVATALQIPVSAQVPLPTVIRDTADCAPPPVPSKTIELSVQPTHTITTSVSGTSKVKKK